MSQRIKLIWDFKGPNASQTAAHHILHLEEFSRSEKLENTLCGLENVHDMHHIAYLVVEKKHMDDLRERLKPQQRAIIPRKIAYGIFKYLCVCKDTIHFGFAIT